MIPDDCLCLFSPASCDDLSPVQGVVVAVGALVSAVLLPVLVAGVGAVREYFVK